MGDKLKEVASNTAELLKTTAESAASKLINEDLIKAEARKVIAANIADKLKKTAVGVADELIATARVIAKMLLKQLVDNAMFVAIFDSIGDGVVVATQEGDIQFVNKAAKEIIGELGKVAPADFTSHFHFYKPDKITPWTPNQDPLARALQGSTTIGELMWVKHDENEGTFISCMSVPLTYKDGDDNAVIGGVLIFRKLALVSDNY